MPVFRNFVFNGTNELVPVFRQNGDSREPRIDELDEFRVHYYRSKEYFPFGGTAFFAGDNVKEVSLKDYRYSGKEMDDGTGFYYFGYCYCAPRIGNWLSPDPIGPEDSLNLYKYVSNNPVNLVDPIEQL